MKLRRLLGGTTALAMAMNVFLAIPISTSASETRFEFEDGVITGSSTSVQTSISGYSGTGYVDLQDLGDTITITVTVDTTGMYDLTFCVNTYYSGPKTQYLYINGTSAGTLVSDETSKKWVEQDYGAVKLNAGENTITIESYWGWTLYDYVEVTPYVNTTSLAISNELCDENATSETQGLMNYLATVYGDYIIAGTQECYYYGNSDMDYEVKYLYNLTGEMPAIRGFDFMNMTNPMYGYDDGTTDRIIEWVNTNGGIATACWHLTVPTDFASYEIGTAMAWSLTGVTYGTGTDFSPSNIVNDPTSKEYQYFMLAVDNLAQELLTLQDAGIPIILRPLHEAEGSGGESGSWFWWGKDGSEVYKQLWILLYETLTEDYGVHNVIWEWNSYTYSTSEDWYPGSDYVDLVGYDKYNASVYNPNESACSNTFYSLVEMYGETDGKMISMAECDTIPSIENLLDESAYWLYVCPWYECTTEEDSSKFLSCYNNSDTLIAFYQSDSVITLSELPDYRTYEYTGESFVPVVKSDDDDDDSSNDDDSDKTQIDATITEEDGVYYIDLGTAVGDTLYVELNIDSNVYFTTGAVCAAIEYEGEYYWVQSSWTVQGSTGAYTCVVDMTDISVSFDDEPVEDEAIIAYMLEAFTSRSEFEGRVWWNADTEWNEIDTSTTQYTGAYILTADTGNTDDAVAGDVNGDGLVNIIDVIALNQMIAGTLTVTDNADVNGDGIVNSDDSLYLLRAIVGLETL